MTSRSIFFTKATRIRNRTQLRVFVTTQTGMILSSPRHNMNQARLLLVTDHYLDGTDFSPHRSSKEAIAIQAHLSLFALPVQKQILRRGDNRLDKDRYWADLPFQLQARAILLAPFQNVGPVQEPHVELCKVGFSWWW